MKYKSGSILVVTLLILCLAACGVATVMSYRTFTASRDSEASESVDVIALQEEVAQLRVQLVTLDQRLSEMAGKPIENAHSPGGMIDNDVRDRMASQEEEIRRLQEIVHSTGLDDLASNGHLNPEFLESMHDMYDRGNKLVDQRKEMIARNKTQRESDVQKYGDDLAALYAQARPGTEKENRGNADASDDAFLVMLEEYPDAYSTGMVIGERALQSAMKMNADEVAEYYDLLSENDNFSHVVTDFGVEAMPAIQNYLARQYIQDGDIEKAEEIISSLEENFGDSLVAERGRGGEPSWRSTSEVIGSLRDQMSGGTPPPQ